MPMTARAVRPFGRPSACARRRHRFGVLLAMFGEDMSRRSREPSLQPATMTRLPPLCRLRMWAMAASNTLACSSARSGAKLRPGLPPASMTSPFAASGTAKGSSCATLGFIKTGAPFLRREIERVGAKRLIDRARRVEVVRLLARVVIILDLGRSARRRNPRPADRGRAARRRNNRTRCRCRSWNSGSQCSSPGWRRPSLTAS